VGRERELALLRDLYDESSAEPIARVALVAGVAGAGKSRLRHELVGALVESSRPPRVLVARGAPMASGAPLGLLASMLRDAFGVREGEPLNEARKKIETNVSGVVARHATRVSAFLGEIIGVPFPNTDIVELRAARSDAALMGDQMKRAWLDFLGEACSASPVLLVLEDLHWGGRAQRPLHRRRAPPARRTPTDGPCPRAPRGPRFLAGPLDSRDLTLLKLGPITRRASGTAGAGRVG
jgi:predicted ATPase